MQHFYIPLIMTMISNFTIFFIYQTFIFNFFLTFIRSCCSFIDNFIFFFLKLIIFIACCLKNSQNFFMQSLPPLYTSCLFSMLLNKNIVDIEKPNKICSLTFVVNKFSRLFLHPSIFSIIHRRSAKITYGV